MLTPPLNGFNYGVKIRTRSQFPCLPRFPAACQLFISHTV
jgi:hypothetical protein